MPITASQSSPVNLALLPRLSAGMTRKGRFAMRSDMGVTLRIGVRFHVALGFVADSRQSDAGACT